LSVLMRILSLQVCGRSYKEGGQVSAQSVEAEQGEAI
jgi:hypothetical protein